MRIGPADAQPILLLPPLFEEMNRTRAFLATIMRMLAANGFGCWLPSLPGTGESALSLEACEWQSWRDAARDAGACGMPHAMPERAQPRERPVSWRN